VQELIRVGRIEEAGSLAELIGMGHEEIWKMTRFRTIGGNADAKDICGRKIES